MGDMLNVIDISARFSKLGAERFPDDAAIVLGGTAFASDARLLHPDRSFTHVFNAAPLRRMQKVVEGLAADASAQNLAGVILPHENGSPRARMITEAICAPISEKYNLIVRLQRGVFILEADRDESVRTCFEHGTVRVLRYPNILSLGRAA